jgi:hypothetical protein
MADNMFDDVDDILTDDLSDDDKSFNEAELQDIMSEIEDLEKEFVNAEPHSKNLAEKIEADEIAQMSKRTSLDEVLTVKSQNVKDVMDTNFSEEMSSEEENEVEEEMDLGDIVDAQEIAPIKTQILPFEKVTPKFKSKDPEVTLDVKGQMSLNLDFKVGSESAKLSIDPLKGLSVTVSGVEIIIDDVTGCTVTMNNGMKFTIPLSSDEKSLKKKTA